MKGCAPLLNSGDPATFSAVYTITPQQVITSPVRRPGNQAAGQPVSGPAAWPVRLDQVGTDRR